MTICSAAISKEGIVVISDCRVTYDNNFSDTLQKTYPLTKYSSLSFAGDIYCAKFIITNLNGKQLNSYAKKGAYQLLIHTARQIRNLYERYSLQRLDCAVSFLLTGYSGSNYWIGTCRSPKFNLELTNTLFSTRTIGDEKYVRDAVSKSMTEAVSSNFTGDNLVFLAGASVDGALNLFYLDKYDNRENEHGISGMFMHFKVSEIGVQTILYNTEMFRGRIADRNSPLGYSKTNSIEFDQLIGRFKIHDHQSGKSNILTDISTFCGQQWGIINTNFDPYKLKG